MNSIQTNLNQHLQYLKHSKNSEAHYLLKECMPHPLNTITASEDAISATEQKLGCTLPAELKDYYLTGSNGSSKDTSKYAINSEGFDLFSHERIMGIVDFSVLYWSQFMSQSPFEYHTGTLTPLSTDEQEFLLTNNKEYFVCFAKWSENFVLVIAFDKQHRFYHFAFDQDETISEYINEMIDEKPNTLSKHSIEQMLNTYYASEKQDLEDGI